MSSIHDLLAAIDERKIARQVGIPHDETRARYRLHSNTARDFDEFSDIIGEYYAYHYGACVARGGHLSRSAATSRAKEIIVREYRRQRGDIVSAYNDASDGTNGGLRAILDTIAENLKAESVEHYLRDVFDRYVKPNSWDSKVDIIRQFIARCGPILPSLIQRNSPERYAQNYEDLLRSYVDALRGTSQMFRRL